MNTTWKSLVRSALVGTQHHPPAIPPGGGALGGLLGQIDDSDSEHLLLSAAAVVTVYQVAGARPISSLCAEIPTPCPPETRPVCSPSAAHFLEEILNGTLSNQMLNDWLDAAAAAGVRVPHHLLVGFLNLLQREASNGHIDPAVSDIIGERGRWLAAHRDFWAFLNWRDNFESAWVRSPARIRHALFRQYRILDPTAARRFFEARNHIMHPLDCSLYVDWLALSQHSDDEALLERLLDATDTRIVQSAADRLRRMPGSAYVQRMVNRLSGRFWLEQSFGGSQHIAFSPYQELSEAMDRDAVARIPPRYLSEQMGWLHYMISCVPPHYWCDWLGETPARLIRMGSAQPQLFIEAWVRAASFHKDLDWARALIDYLIDKDAAHLISWLIKVLPPEEQERVALRLWRSSSRGVYIYAMLLSNQKWGSELSEQVVQLYAAALRENPEDALSWLRYGLPNHIYYLHPGVIGQLRSIFAPYLTRDETNEVMRSAVEDALNLLQTRQDIRTAFTHEEPHPAI